MREIPIKNIYYMALYAWDKIDNKDILNDKSLEKLENSNEVIIELFLNEVSKLAKKGLYGEYNENVYNTKYIRGKIQIQESIKLIKPNLICQYDEFSKNNVLNQIIKTTLIRVSRLRNINFNLKRKANSLLLEFNEIQEVLFSKDLLNNIYYNQLNKDYRFAIDLAVFIYNNSIPAEKYGSYKFIEIFKDEEKMSTIFESFIRNFYKIHSNYNVSRKKYNWDLEPVDNSDINLLPIMETDIELIKEKEKIIIDAKYYKDAFNYRFESKKFIPNHLYQISAYMNKNKKLYENIRGILIYPSNGYKFHEKYVSPENYFIEFKSLDLSKDWDCIKNDLLDLII
jgi:5-methylcytosine-specific restriction enzyme subunit McrC